jgi:hypothetical protein
VTSVLYIAGHVSALQRNAFNFARAHIPLFHFTDATVFNTDYVHFSWGYVTLLGFTGAFELQNTAFSLNLAIYHAFTTHQWLLQGRGMA